MDLRHPVDITTTAQWDALTALPAPAHLGELFAGDPGRSERYLINVGDLRIDYSKQRVDDAILVALLAVAGAAGVAERRDAMFRGERINVTEDRPVLHVALRADRSEEIGPIGADGTVTNVVPDVHDVLGAMGAFAERVRNELWLGATGKPIRTVVNIGIGGSDLGPAMAYRALRHYAQPGLSCRFVSNVDGAAITEAIADLDPAETLFVVSSKTFTTIETLTNARTARAWLVDALGEDGRRPALRRREHERRRGRRLRHRHRQHVRLLGVGRWALLGRLGDRPVADDRHRRRTLRRVPRRLPRSSTSTSARRHWRRTPRWCSG